MLTLYIAVRYISLEDFNSPFTKINVLNQIAKYDCKLFRTRRGLADANTCQRYAKLPSVQNVAFVLLTSEQTAKTR